MRSRSWFCHDPPCDLGQITHCLQSPVSPTRKGSVGFDHLSRGHPAPGSTLTMHKHPDITRPESPGSHVVCSLQNSDCLPLARNALVLTILVPGKQPPMEKAQGHQPLIIQFKSYRHISVCLHLDGLIFLITTNTYPANFRQY